MKLSHAARRVRAGRSLALIAALIAVPASYAQNPSPTFDDLPFATVATDSGADKELNLDLYLPQVRPGRQSPVVLWIHGGGWRAGTHNNVPDPVFGLLDRGIAVASVEYRLSGEAVAPAQIHDVKGAVRFLRASADQYNLDPNRFGAWGSSAGGHLAALLGASGGVADAEGDVGGNLDQSSTVQAVVDYFGPTDLLNMEPDERTPPGGGIDHDAYTSPESGLIGFNQPGEGIGVLRENIDNPAAPFPEKAALVSLLSPLTHVDADDPPFLIAHGDQDTVVPFLQSVRLADALDAVSVPVRLRRVEGAGHGNAQMTDDVNRAAVNFLTRTLRGVPEPSGAAMSVLSLACLAPGRRRRG